MKNWLLLLLMPGFCLSLHSQFATVQPRTANIYHRYYLIKRLERACELLRELSSRRIISCEFPDVAHFTCESIRATIERMRTEKNTCAFFELWQEFCEYREIYDERFKHELVELLYMLYTLMEPKRMLSTSNSLEQMLFAIDCAGGGECCTEERSVREVLPEQKEVTTDLIAKRFYILKRLQKSIDFLERLHANNFKFSLSAHRLPDQENNVISELANFAHDRVRESIVSMYQKKTLEPLLILCNEAKQYRFAQDESFLQEMLMHIFLVYKTMLLKSGSQSANSAILYEINQVLQIYEHLNSMPLDQTLEAIDEVTDRLMAIQAERESRFAGQLKPAIVAAVSVFVGSVVYYYSVWQ